MKAIKCYLAASDYAGAHLYMKEPVYDKELDRWMPADDRIGDIYGYLNNDLLLDMNIDISVLMEVPKEILLVVESYE